MVFIHVCIYIYTQYIYIYLSDCTRVICKRAVESSLDRNISSKLLRLQFSPDQY